MLARGAVLPERRASVAGRLEHASEKKVSLRVRAVQGEGLVQRGARSLRPARGQSRARFTEQAVELGRALSRHPDGMDRLEGRKVAQVGGHLAEEDRRAPGRLQDGSEVPFEALDGGPVYTIAAADAGPADHGLHDGFSLHAFGALEDALRGGPRHAQEPKFEKPPERAHGPGVRSEGGARGGAERPVVLVMSEVQQEKVRLGLLQLLYEIEDGVAVDCRHGAVDDIDLATRPEYAQPVLEKAGEGSVGVVRKPGRARFAEDEDADLPWFFPDREQAEAGLRHDAFHVARKVAAADLRVHLKELDTSGGVSQEQRLVCGHTGQTQDALDRGQKQKRQKEEKEPPPEADPALEEPRTRRRADRPAFIRGHGRGSPPRPRCAFRRSLPSSPGSGAGS